MRVRVLFGMGSIAVMVGMLWGSVTPARACTCADLTSRQFLDAADLVVVGRIRGDERDTEQRGYREGNVTYLDPFAGLTTIEVEEYLKGRGPSTLVFALDLGCSEELADGIGSEYVGFLRKSEGRLLDSTCFGSGGLSWDQGAKLRLNDVQAITGPGLRPDPTLERLGPNPSDAREFPALSAAILAVLGPVAFLAGAAFVCWRREPHSG